MAPNNSHPSNATPPEPKTELGLDNDGTPYIKLEDSGLHPIVLVTSGLNIHIFPDERNDVPYIKLRDLIEFYEREVDSLVRCGKDPEHERARLAHFRSVELAQALGLLHDN